MSSLCVLTFKQELTVYYIATTRTSRLLGFEESKEIITKADFHIIVKYEIQSYFLLIEASKFEKFYQKMKIIKEIR